MTTEETSNEPQVQLSIHDLQVVREIISLCSARGAFKAQELSTVGAVFNKLDAFLKAIEEQQAGETEEESVEEPADVTEGDE